MFKNKFHSYVGASGSDVKLSCEQYNEITEVLLD